VKKLVVNNFRLSFSLRHLVLVIIIIRSDVVNDVGELALAERALCLHLGPLQETGEAELVEAGVGERLVVQLTQADRTRRVLG
jgi:hypothetical protein